MKRQIWKQMLWKQMLWTPLLALGLLDIFHAASAAPDAPQLSTALYDGKTASQDNLTVGNWGGGSAEESTDLFLFGGHSLKVTTLDLYQGAKISFLTPVALAGGPDRVFQVTLQRGAVTLHYDPQAGANAAPTDPQAAPGGFGGGRGRGRRRGGFGGGGNPGDGNPGGFGPGGGNPGGFGPGGGNPGGFGPSGGNPGGFGPSGGGFGGRGRGRGRDANAAPLIPEITKLRLEFTLADGRQADVVQAIPDTVDTVAGDGWYSVNVPLSSLKFAGGAAALLKSVTVAGDQYGVFFIGRMQIAPTPAPLAETAKPVPAEEPAADDGDLSPAMDSPGNLPPGAGNAPPDTSGDR